MESIVQVEGTVTKANTPISSTTQSSIELSVSNISVLSKSGPLAFTVQEASRSENYYDQQVIVPSICIWSLDWNTEI